MLRKSMIALCAVASIAMLTPDLALARGGGGGGGGGHGGGGGGGRGAAGFGGGGSFGARGVSSGGNFGASFARVTPGAGVAVVQGNRFGGGNFGRSFHNGRRFVGGGFWGPGYDDGYWGYPDYAYDDSYYGNGGCYVVPRRVHTAYGWRVRPVQVCG